MISAALAQRAYATSQTPIRTFRGTEYEVFAHITSNIRSAAAEGPMGFSALATALHENRRLWTLLAADVADESNDLPRTLRAQIFYLAEFTMEHSRKVLSGDAAADALVEINLAVMRGLRGDTREGNES